jgi:hypothetical protein
MCCDNSADFISKITPIPAEVALRLMHERSVLAQAERSPPADAAADTES